MAKKLKRQRKAEKSFLRAKEVFRKAKNLDKSIEHMDKKADEVHRAADRVHRKTEAVHQFIRKKIGRSATPDLVSLKTFPIVGIGASAGGLEAVTQLFENFPANTGMTFVLVQHLDPTHESALASLLARATKMPVTEAKNNTQLEPNQIYVIPPDKVIEISNRTLKLLPRDEGSKAEYFPIDHFLYSLAQHNGDNIAAIILSGNGSDGTKGLTAVKAAGGITFAQDTQSAKFPTMPANAAAAGCVDFILPPQKIAHELERIAGRLKEVLPNESETPPPNETKAFENILAVLRQRTAVDFTFYKHPTLRRRIHRRMMLHKLESLAEYGDFLRTHAGEAKQLFNDILIHVTEFFRDTAVFQVLKKKILPRLLRNKSSDDVIRIWIAGCSSGEEVYSLAILLTEAMADKNIHCSVQIFGTDINDIALEKARAGFYPESINAEVSAERLQRFFVRADGGYRVNKAVREMCIFARQNLAVDPPFSNLDLISCRNVLIYLGRSLQQKTFPMFHYALRPGGLLMLGASESIGAFSDLFLLVDKKAKIYSKKETRNRPAVSFGHRTTAAVSTDGGNVAPIEPMPPEIPNVQKQADRIVLTTFSPAGVVINKHMEVLQFRGHTSPFLEHPHGEANLHLLKMAREELVLDLRAVITKAIKQNATVRQEHIRIRQNGHSFECNIEVVPFTVPPSQEKFYLVLFERKNISTAIKKDEKKSRGKSSQAAEDARVARLQRELAAMRESLQDIISEQEATNEELRSASEEILSSNEELQSTNEELETAKEELQSTNEELTTLNDELESRNAELEQLNNDLHNLLASVNIPVIILKSDLRIRRFTTAAEKLFNLIPGDIGRPITDISAPLDIPHFEKQVLEVLETLVPKDLELQDRQGHWWSARIRAYRTTDHKIDGVVIALVDIDLLKVGIEKIEQARNFAEAIVNTVREPMLVLDNQLVVKSANPIFYRTFKVNAKETIGRHIYVLGDRHFDIPKLRTLLKEILHHNNSLNDFEVEHYFPNLGKKRLLLNARRLVFDGLENQMILLAIEDASGHPIE